MAYPALEGRCAAWIIAESLARIETPDKAFRSRSSKNGAIYSGEIGKPRGTDKQHDGSRA